MKKLLKHIDGVLLTVTLVVLLYVLSIVTGKVL
jgi:hypothetical protein